MRFLFWDFDIPLWLKWWNLTRILKAIRNNFVFVGFFIKGDNLFILTLNQLIFLIEIVIINFVSEIFELYTNFADFSEESRLYFLIFGVIIEIRSRFLFQYFWRFAFFITGLLWLWANCHFPSILLVSELTECLIRSRLVIGKLIVNNLDADIYQLFEGYYTFI